MPADAVPALYLAKGNYFSLSGRNAVLAPQIYPMPRRGGGLGVHMTLDLAGQARFGPDVEWVDAIDYAVDARRADSFYAAIRNLLAVVASMVRCNPHTFRDQAQRSSGQAARKRTSSSRPRRPTA